jgi:hypothetical protein
MQGVGFVRTATGKHPRFADRKSYLLSGFHPCTRDWAWTGKNCRQFLRRSRPAS